MRQILCFRPLLLITLLLLLSRVGWSQRPDVARVDSFMRSLAEHNLFNGGILIAEQGRIIYKRFAGYADRHRQLPHTDTTAFNIASLAKPFTALAVLQLAQKRKLKLDDALVTYLPDFPYPTVTVRHLLTQTSGLPILERMEDEYVKAHPDERLTNQNVYTHLVDQKKPLLFPAGDNWRYNNMNYVLLALLVEKVSRKPFAAYLKQQVFTPANMQRTYVREPTMPNTARYMRPAFYSTKYEYVDSLDYRQHYTYYQLGDLIGSNNVVSTLQDLWRFDEALFAGKLVSQTLLETAFVPVTLNNGQPFRMGSSTRSYGLGWNVYSTKTEPVNQYIFHDGHIPGLSTVMNRNLTKKQTVLFYDNMDGNPIQVMVAVTNLLNGQAPPKLQMKQSLARVYGEALVAKGPDYAATKFNELKDDTVRYYRDELEMNRLGLELLQAQFANHNELALEVLKLNTLLYPKSGNTYDSYAIALAQNKRKEEAIAMYRKSIALWPTNEDGKKALQKLLAE